jgi:CheY-like chemotaxis protein
MVYGMAERHGADVRITSTIGKGTDVALLFPVPSDVASDPVPSEASYHIPRRLRVLVVDDDPLLLKSLRDTLVHESHAVVTAGGGQAGIDTFLHAKAHGESFSVVITDLGMPYVDGREVARAVKEASATTPVILLTGWGRHLLADGDIPPHVDRVLSKPPRLRELRETMAAFCNPPDLE